MNYEDTKVILVGRTSYVTLPSGTHISVDDVGKLDIVRMPPAGEALKPYPFTGDHVPTVAAERAIENAIKLDLALQCQEEATEKGT